MRRLLGIFPVEHIGRDAGDYLTRIHVSPWDWWPWNKRLYLHVFSRPDMDKHPHDHPFGFRSIILWGSYTESVYERRGVGIRPWWKQRLVRRGWLSSHRVDAGHIHKIVMLHRRKVVTLVIRGRKEQDWGFWVGETGGDKTKVPWWIYLGLPEKPPAAYGEH